MELRLEDGPIVVRPWHTYYLAGGTLHGFHNPGGEAVEVVEEQEYPFPTGTIFHIAPGEKHMTINRSDQDFRYLEFYTCPPLSADFFEVK